MVAIGWCGSGVTAYWGAAGHLALDRDGVEPASLADVSDGDFTDPGSGAEGAP